MAAPSPPRPTPLAERDGFDLPRDPYDAERRKTERLVRLNTRDVPRLRAVGTFLVLATALVHNSLVLGDTSLQPWLRLAAIATTYCIVTWYLLHLFYADARKYLDVGIVFLTTDLWLFALVVYATGAERSWLFFLPLFRVVDQTPSSFRRAFAFAHLAPISYLGVILYVAFVDHRTIPPGPEIAKLLVHLWRRAVHRDDRADVRRSARPPDRERSGSHVSSSGNSSRKASRSSPRRGSCVKRCDKQARLARENAELYATAQREKARQSQIFDSTSDGIIFVTPDGRIEAANVRSRGAPRVRRRGRDRYGAVASRVAPLLTGRRRQLRADAPGRSWPIRGTAAAATFSSPRRDACSTGSRSRPATARGAARDSPSRSRT